MSTASEGASRGGQTTHLGTLRFASVACALIRLRGIRRTGRLAAVALRSASGYHGIWLPHYSASNTSAEEAANSWRWRPKGKRKTMKINAFIVSLSSMLTVVSACNTSAIENSVSGKLAGVTSEGLAASCTSYSWALCQQTWGLSAGEDVDVATFRSSAGEDAAAIQTAVCCASAMASAVASGGAGTTRAVVNFGSGFYTVDTAIKIPIGTSSGSGAGVGIALKGAGAQLSGASPIFTTASVEHVSNDDSMPLIIEDFVFDGSASSTSSLVDIASTVGTGETVAILRNLTFKNLSGNAIVLRGVSARVQGIMASNITGKVVEIAGNKPVHIFLDNVVAKAVDGSGSGKIKISQAPGRYFVNNIDIDGSLEMIFPSAPSSTFQGSNINAPNGPFKLSGNHSLIKISNSVIGSTSDPSVNGLGSIGNFAFSQTTFRLRKVTEGVSYRILNASVGIPTSTLQFNDCTFETDSSLDAGDLVYGLVVGGGPDQRMRVNVQGGIFDSTAVPLDYAVYAQGGLSLAIQGTLFRGDSSTTAVYLGGSGSPYVNEVLLDGLRVDHDVSCELGGGNAQHFVTHRNVIVPANQACSNYAAWVLTGERVLVGTVAPSGSCKPSDIYRLEPIPASGIVQWQCAADSTWHAVASLQ